MLTGAGGDDILVGGSGIDHASYAGSTSGVTVDLAAGTATGSEVGSDSLKGIERAIGGSGDDVLTGDGGDDTLIGGKGSDTLKGGEGSDSYLVGDCDAEVYEDTGTSGTDSIRFLTGSFTGHLGASFSAAASGIEAIDGSDAFALVLAGADSAAALDWDFTGMTLTDISELKGGDGDDVIKGSSAAELITGGAGDDSLTGNSGADVLQGGGNDDALRGNGGADNLTGGGGADDLWGGGGNDSLTGSAGSDRLSGDGGDDSLTGGSGADTFVFADDFAHDTVTDFEIGTDVIEVSGLGYVDVQAILDALTQDGADSLLSVDTPAGTATDSLRLTGIDKDDLTQNDFALVA